jgi:RNA polymerase sigma factor (sigma-70 family)
VAARERKTAPGRRPSGTAEWRRLAIHARAVAAALAPDRPALAEDLAQEALLKLLVQEPSPVRPLAWLRVTLRNLATDRHRRDERCRTLPIDGVEEPAHPHQDSPHRTLVVRQALEVLSEAQRTILGLYALGFSHAEIADRIGCRTHQVGPRIQRALRRARRALHSSEEDPARD